jgi:hypothetical protein
VYAATGHPIAADGRDAARRKHPAITGRSTARELTVACR